VWVKICGIRDEATARDVAALRPDAIGLNFYAPSPRSVTIDVAARIVAALSPEVEPVGLFVNASAEEVRRTARTFGLRTLQLHGDEPPELIAELAEFRILRAFRVGAGGLAEVERQLNAIASAGVSLSACLIDARVEGRYGGTGVTAPWDVVRQWRHSEWPPLVLAGGLTPDNVSDAIRQTRPWGVDVAGGVESQPGRKDLELVRAFIENARAAS
jgi:phosphoribosylanthranilate isomerase